MSAPRPVALVTGGSRGIGRAVVQTLAAQGWIVAFTWREREEEARRLAEEIGGAGRPFRFDLRDRARAGDLVREVEEQVGPIEGLVNNAGVRRDGLLATLADDGWDELIDANLGGVFRCCRAAVPRMLHRRRGSIVNVSSMTAVHGLAGQAAYGAAKAGILGLTRSLAREVGSRGVRVNAVIPGFVPTEMVADIPPERVKALRSAEALPAGVTTGGVAGAVAFLLSDAAASITGQTLVVDAGLLA
ncbi:MAG TPA: SDR family oxidoreductase [Candidatus Polarisedimenticolia bacterium]|nr:SDR family oxidoreductase [Candidatus Polarisedimenticolia bacterium]